MNYRHEYHAGNFADCFKHPLLMALLESFARKAAPYFVMDTHAGSGQYDLEGQVARRTDEATNGIRRLLQHPDPALQRYFEVVTGSALYPGSPMLIRTMMRANDRLTCCELHFEDAATLRRQFHSDPQVEVHHRSGWEALSAFLPPRERRGLVFIDPPFELRDEFSMVADGLCRGYERFRHGVFAAWYPIKQMAAVRGFHTKLASSGIRDVITVELHLRETTDPERLNGCGLVVINPPYQFEQQAQSIARAVLAGVGDHEAGSGTSVIRLADE